MYEYTYCNFCSTAFKVEGQRSSSMFLFKGRRCIMDTAQLSGRVKCLGGKFTVRTNQKEIVRETARPLYKTNAGAGKPWTVKAVLEYIE